MPSLPRPVQPPVQDEAPVAMWGPSTGVVPVQPPMQEEKATADSYEIPVPIEVGNAKEDEDEKEDELTDEGMSLEASTWEVVMLVNVMTLLKGERVRVLNRCQTFVAFLLFVLTVVFQVTFVMAVEITMASSSIDDATIKGVMEQRLSMNHKWSNLNLRDLTTRTKDLCDGYVLNTLGGIYASVDSYVEPDEVIEGTGIRIGGRIIVCIAIVIWICTMTTELRRIFELGLAVASLSGRPKGEVHAEKEDDSLVIKRAGVFYKSLILFCVLLPRLIIAAVLLYSGCRYLANTLEVSNMILNCCALEIVKSIDEYLFEALMSRRLSGIIQSTRYVYYSVHERTTRGQINEAVPTAVRILFIAGVLTYTIAVPLQSFSDDTRSFKEWACTHDLDFAWINHPLVGLPWFTSVSKSLRNTSAPTDAEYLQCFYKAHTLLLETRMGTEINRLTGLPVLANTSLKNFVRGKSSDCDSDSTHPSAYNCPNVPVGRMLSLEAMSSSDILEDQSLCGDYEPYLGVLAEACQDDEHASSVFKKDTGDLRTTCAEFAYLCECEINKKGNEVCSLENYTEVVKKYNVPFVWIQRLIKAPLGDLATDPGGSPTTTAASPLGGPERRRSGGREASRRLIGSRPGS